VEAGAVEPDHGLAAGLEDEALAPRLQQRPPAQAAARGGRRTARAGVSGGDASTRGGRARAKVAARLGARAHFSSGGSCHECETKASIEPRAAGVESKKASAELPATSR
jgi:hypothetical protein